ncbi:MAG: hypothetical protein ACK5B9_03790 [Flavobacteriia bacterium]|jgi:hypothetical protein
MKKLKNVLLLVFIFGALFSCTIQKRTVNKGYFVQWNWDKKIKNQGTTETKVKPESEVQIEIAQTEPIFEEQKSSTSVSDEIEVQDAPVVEENNTSKKSLNSTFNTLKEIKPISKGVTVLKKIHDKVFHKKKAATPPMDGELWINIGLLILFLILTIVFISLALKAIEYMVFVWWGLALVAFIVFVTQVIDVIMW